MTDQLSESETLMSTTSYQVTGMTCGHCEMSIREEVGTIDQVGGGPVGQRMIAALSGGSFAGERLAGTVAGSSGDWLLVGHDGYGRTDVRLTLKTVDYQESRSQGTLLGKALPGLVPSARLAGLGSMTSFVRYDRFQCSPSSTPQLHQPISANPLSCASRITCMSSPEESCWDLRVIARPVGHLK